MQDKRLVALSQALCSKTRRGKSLVTSSCQLPAPCSGGTKSDCSVKPCVHFVHSPKFVNSKMNLLAQTTPQILVKNSFWTCRKDASLESLRSKFTVVGLWDRLAHRTSQLRVCMYSVRHGTQQSCRYLTDEEQNHK